MVVKLSPRFTTYLTCPNVVVVVGINDVLDAVTLGGGFGREDFDVVHATSTIIDNAATTPTATNF